jgi:hypothetical protein
LLQWRRDSEVRYLPLLRQHRSKNPQRPVPSHHDQHHRTAHKHIYIHNAFHNSSFFIQYPHRPCNELFSNRIELNRTYVGFWLFRFRKNSGEKKVRFGLKKFRYKVDAGTVLVPQNSDQFHSTIFILYLP